MKELLDFSSFGTLFFTGENFYMYDLKRHWSVPMACIYNFHEYKAEDDELDNHKYWRFFVEDKIVIMAFSRHYETVVVGYVSATDTQKVEEFTKMLIAHLSRVEEEPYSWEL